MSMVHDNVILSFNVDYEAETLTLLTDYHTEKLHEKTTIVFSDYLTHIFEHQQKNTIILDIEEESSEYFVESNKSFLEQSVNYGYPIAYHGAVLKCRAIRSTAQGDLRTGDDDIPRDDRIENRIGEDPSTSHCRRVATDNAIGGDAFYRSAPQPASAVGGAYIGREAATTTSGSSATERETAQGRAVGQPGAAHRAGCPG